MRESEGIKQLGIRALRLAAGLTQVELAKKMKIDQSTVSLWESGKTSPQRKIRKKLAKVLGCTVEQLTEVCNGTDRSDCRSGTDRQSDV